MKRFMGFKAAGVITSAFCVLALCGCGHSPPTHLFSLQMTPPPAPAASVYAGRSIRVDAVHVPPDLDRAEIVTEVAPGELRIEDFDHWAAPLGRMARQALTEDLAARLPSGTITFADAAQSGDSDGLTVDILSFHNSGGVAVMQVNWRLSVKGAAGLQRLTRLKRPVIASGPAGASRAFSDLLGDLADQITLQLISDQERR